MKAGRKSTEIEYEQKLIRAYELMVYYKKSYVEFRDIISKEFEITTRAAENIWFDCKNRLKEKFNQEREEIVNEQLLRYFDLLQRARDEKNKRIEVEVLRDLTKLYGIDAPQKIDVTTGGEKLSINIVLDNQ
jgi:hypothetical protein